MLKIAIRFVVPCLALGLLAGCASYYEIKNPATGQVYFTKKMEQGREGAVMFEDARTGANVTIQNSEVKKVSEERYNEGLKASNMAPAPAPTTMPK